MSQSQNESHAPVVLVVDDNSSIRDMVSWALELDGYEPAEATEGQEALDWLDNAAREGCYPAVILLDLAMPGMGGRLFLEHLQDQWQGYRVSYPRPAIVVITAGPTVAGTENLVVDRIVAKPFHVRDLLDVVRTLAHV